MLLPVSKSDLFVMHLRCYVQADVVVIVYSLDNPSSWESVKTKWIPLVIEEGGSHVLVAVRINE